MITTYGFGKYNFDYRNMSDEAGRLVDMEIDALVDECYAEAREILSVHRRQLDELKNKLIEDEIVDGDWVYGLFHSVPRRLRGDLDSLDYN